MITKALVILLASFTVSISFAGEVVSCESDICIFNLHGYELPPHIERAIVFGVSRILDTYKDTFGFSYPDDFKVTVTIFVDKNEFLKYQEEQIGSIISEWGYASYKDNEAVVLNEKNTKKTEDAKEMVASVFHETNHLILGYNIPCCPSWVNEGLSEYFEGMNVFGKNRRVYLQSNRIKWCKYWLKNGFPIEIDKFIGLTYDEWMKFRSQDINAAYTIGYSLVYYMMSRSKTEGVLKEILWGYKKTGKDIDSIEIINQNYSGGVKKLEEDWQKWIPLARPYRPLRALRKDDEKAKKDEPAQEQGKS